MYDRIDFALRNVKSLPDLLIYKKSVAGYLFFLIIYEV